MEQLVSVSQAMSQVKSLISQVARSMATVLILGESGTGKERVARSIHAQSAGAHHAFIPVNCGAIPADLLETELFGHEKGAFTGALSRRQGRFEMAHQGTLFLDEIGDMPLLMQVKLLRVLQERCFERIGGHQTVHADFRVIAATHQNLDTLLEKGLFREDLFYRLNVFPIFLPALRERLEDIPVLIHAILAQFKAEGRQIATLTPETIQCLCQYHWPGNVRELANIIERVCILYPGKKVQPHELPEKCRTSRLAFELPKLMPPSSPLIFGQEGIDLKVYLADTEKALIRCALTHCGGGVARAAQYLHLKRTTLIEKIRRHRIEICDSS